MARTLHVTLPRAPMGARVTAESLDALGERLVAERLQGVYAAALDEGRRAAEETSAKALDAALEQLETQRDDAELRLAREAVELAVEIADQLLRLRLEDGAYDIERIVRSALAGGGVDRGHCLVHLNPADAASLANTRFRSDTELCENPDLPRGTCHVETPRGLLVRDPHEAMTQVRETLLEGLV